LLKRGQLDQVVSRLELRDTLIKILEFHA
jgi:acetyl-CoA carboxylase carboxyl transferase subunit beta